MNSTVNYREGSSFIEYRYPKRMKNRIPQGKMIPQYRKLKLKSPKYRLKKSSIPQYRKPPCPPLRGSIAPKKVERLPAGAKTSRRSK